MQFNGHGRELQADDDHIEESVYCTQCGTIFVRNRHRDCPSCTLYEKSEGSIETLEEDLSALEDEVDTFNDDAVDDLVTIRDKVDRLLKAKRAVNREAGRR